MQYEVTTPAEYLEVLDKDWRLTTLEQIRAILKVKAFDFKEGINYKMLSYSDDKGACFHLNAQKNYVSFYVGDASKIDPKGELLEGIDVGKGCLRFKKSTVVEDTRLDEFIERAASLWKKGVDIAC